MAGVNRGLLQQTGHARESKMKRGKKHNSKLDLAGRCIDPSQILFINNKNSFAVFIQFVEIYNNSVFDLLTNSVEGLHKQPQTKVIREDSRKNMFVHGVTEVEVSSTEEAYQMFYKGLKRKHVAQTVLNACSSRSRSIFTIRVVQADLVRYNSKKGGNKNAPLTIGQLSLVNLAGSERTKRTHNEGKKLVEAGSINNSLMTLCLYFDALKENLKGSCKVVPYRDSKLTTLLKSNFEGDSYISMIVCINPHRDDYDETLQVLLFSESSQEVEIASSVFKQSEQEEKSLDLKFQNRAHELNEEVKEVGGKIQSRGKEPCFTAGHAENNLLR